MVGQLDRQMLRLKRFKTIKWSRYLQKAASNLQDKYFLSVN
jgi:hypothetical protein